MDEAQGMKGGKDARLCNLKIAFNLNVPQASPGSTKFQHIQASISRIVIITIIIYSVHSFMILPIQRESGLELFRCWFHCKAFYTNVDLSASSLEGHNSDVYTLPLLRTRPVHPPY